MAISFSLLTRENALAAHSLLRRTSGRQNWSNEFSERMFEWRFFARRCGETLLALDGERCVAILDAFLRPYLVSGRCITVRETCDWFCLPEYRPLGVGLRLMRLMMAKPEPIVVIGGAQSTRSLLPKLKWQSLCSVSDYVLPVSLRGVTGFGMRLLLERAEKLARLIPPQIKLRRPRRLKGAGASVQVTDGVSGQMLPLPAHDAYGVASLMDEENLRWLALAPQEIGDLVTLNFFVDGVPVGISTSRLMEHVEGRTAKLLHIQSALQSHAMLEWIISETAQQLVARGAGLITCRASCPVVGAALRRVGFLFVRALPAFWWSGGIAPPTGTMHLTMIRGDDALGKF